MSLRLSMPSMPARPATRAFFLLSGCDPAGGNREALTPRLQRKINQHMAERASIGCAEETRSEPARGHGTASACVSAQPAPRLRRSWQRGGSGVLSCGLALHHCPGTACALYAAVITSTALASGFQKLYPTHARRHVRSRRTRPATRACS